MDVIRFTNPTVPTRMEQGIIVNGLTSKMWIERYAEAGEFKFVAPATIKMRNALPIGSFVSHADTTELMVIENHEISGKKDEDSDLIISGRGFETWTENRAIGSEFTGWPGPAVPDYDIGTYVLPDQIMWLLRFHLYAAYVRTAGDDVPNLQVINQVPAGGVAVDRHVKWGDLYSRVLEMLAEDNLGIKVIRPGTWSPLGAATQDVAIAIHKGVDRTASLVLSHDTGEIENAEYLWSNKKKKNAALVIGKWIRTMVTGPETGVNRRFIFIDGSDIDQQYSDYTTASANQAAIVAAMTQRANSALAQQKDVAITKAEVAASATKVKYRRDFDVGDLITVVGDYNASTVARISEYVEIEDESGSKSYPTLSVV